MFAIFYEKELRSIKYYPVGLQAFCDILIGYRVFDYSLYVLLIRYSINEENEWKYTYNGKVAELMRSFQYKKEEFLYEHAYTASEFLSFVYSDLNLITTGYCVLVIAIERYIMVCHPFRAKQIITKTSRIISCVFLTIFLLGYVIRSFYCSNILKMWSSSWYYKLDFACIDEYKSEELFESLFFFVAPAILTTILYTFVAVRLRKTRANRDRTRDITIAFLTSCVLWIILWFPEEASRLIDAFCHSDDKECQTDYNRPETVAYVILQSFNSEMFFLYSMINPVVLVFVCRDFQKPVKKLFQRMRQCRKPNE